MRALVSWSGGKDSLLALEVLLQDPEVEIAGLFTTFNAEGTVTMHEVARELIEAQAEALELPLFSVSVTNEYEQAVSQKLRLLIRELDLQACAFGDLFLEDIRVYRESWMHSLGLQALFPLWGWPTEHIVDHCENLGVEAHVCCVDLDQLPQSELGQAYTRNWVNHWKHSVDPAGEQGEFHTFVRNSKRFKAPIPIHIGQSYQRISSLKHQDGTIVEKKFAFVSLYGR